VRSGFEPAFDWIDLPVFDEHSDVAHANGGVASEPGLYFLGLPFLHSMSSSMVHGVGRDAERIVRVIGARAAVVRRRVGSAIVAS
jgi:putative flavoprotein involved in K+ transport